MKNSGFVFFRDVAWRILCLVMALAVFAVMQASAQQQSDPRLDYAEKLIYTSKGALRIAESENSDAKSAHRRAKELLHQALGEEDDESSAKLLSQAISTMSVAVSLASGSWSKEEKARKDYLNRKDSVEALKEAYIRISSEKGQTAVQEKILQQLNLLQGNADGEYIKENYFEARQILDAGYTLIKYSIEEVRGGETLVKSLVFETKRDEYTYELDRNDTHSMLITVLLGNQPDDVTQRVGAFQASADEYRVEAEKYAEKGDYDTAIKKLDLSTRELVKAIRAGGIYIPG